MANGEANTKGSTPESGKEKSKAAVTPTGTKEPHEKQKQPNELLPTEPRKPKPLGNKSKQLQCTFYWQRAQRTRTARNPKILQQPNRKGRPHYEPGFCLKILPERMQSKWQKSIETSSKDEELGREHTITVTGGLHFDKERAQTRRSRTRTFGK